MASTNTVRVIKVVFEVSKFEDNRLTTGQPDLTCIESPRPEIAADRHQSIFLSLLAAELCLCYDWVKREMTHSRYNLNCNFLLQASFKPHLLTDATINPSLYCSLLHWTSPVCLIVS